MHYLKNLIILLFSTIVFLWLILGCEIIIGGATKSTIALTSLSYGANNSITINNNENASFDAFLIPSGATASFTIDSTVTGVSIASNSALH